MPIHASLCDMKTDEERIVESLNYGQIIYGEILTIRFRA